MPVVPWEAAPAARGPDELTFFTKLFGHLNVEQTFGVGLDVTTTKKASTFSGKKIRKVDPGEIPDSVYEKRAPALRWYGAPNG